MKPASILSEAVEAVHAISKSGVNDSTTRDHVSRHYRAIALPALAAATRRVAMLRAKAGSSAGARTLAAKLQQDVNFQAG